MFLRAPTALGGGFAEAKRKGALCQLFHSPMIPRGTWLPPYGARGMDVFLLGGLFRTNSSETNPIRKAKSFESFFVSFCVEFFLVFVFVSLSKNKHQHKDTAGNRRELSFPGPDPSTSLSLAEKFASGDKKAGALPFSEPGTFESFESGTLPFSEPEPGVAAQSRAVESQLFS